jgi:outer membrane protein
MKLVCLACCAITCALQAQTQTNKTLSLSLQQAVELALQHNLDVQIQRYTPLQSEFTLAEASAIYEPAFNSSVKRTWSEQPGSLSSTGVANLGTRSDDSTLTAGIGSSGGGAAVAPWGLNYSLQTTIDKTTFRRFDSNNVPFLFDQATTFAGITLVQPLLRNAWIDSYRRDILIARKTLTFDELGFRQSVINIIAQTEQAYYELIYDFENVKVQEAAVQLAAQQAQEDRKRVEVGAMAPLDEKQTESQLATSRAALFQAQQVLGTQQNVLKSLISDKYTDIYDVTLVPSEKLLAVPQLFDLQESWQTGIKNRPDLAQARIDLERRGITLRFAKNQLFPELDLTGTYGRRGVENTVNAALDDIPQDRFPTYSYGMVLSVPLGAQGQRAAYRSAKAAIDLAKLNYKKVEQNILIAIQNTVGNINTAMEKIRATRQAREFAEAALEAGRKKLEVGRSTTFEVLGLQRNLTQARTDEIRALADYNQALSVLGQDEGTTLENHHLTVKVK